MNETNFKICCPSCETVFEVTDPSLIGQIVACPKCGGMIMIEEPKEEEPKQTEELEENDKDSYEQAMNASIESECVEPHSVEKTSSIPPVSEYDNDSKQMKEKTRGAWRMRIILIVSGILCALLVMGIWRVLVVSPSRILDDAKNNVSVAENLETPGVEILTSADENEELSEKDSELVLIREEDDLDNSEFDVSGAITFDEEVTLEATTTIKDPEGGADENIDQLVGDSVDEEIERTKSEYSGEDGNEEQTGSKESEEEIGGPNEESALDVEVLIEEPGGNEDEEVLDDGAIPTEFDEERFEKINKSSEEPEEGEEVDLGSIASTSDSEIQKSFPKLKQATKEIDVEARLALKIRSIVFPESPADSVRLLSELAGVPVEFDLASFELIAPSMGTTLDLSLQDTNVGEALKAVAELLKWRISFEKDRIIIGPYDDLTEMIEERFDVADLLDVDFGNIPICFTTGGNQEDWLHRFVVTMVDSDAWGSEESQGSIALEGTELVVKHNALERKRVADLLEKIRALHGMEAKRDSTSDTLIGETLGWERLTKKISFNLLNSTPLQQAIEILERSQKIKVLWDDAALNEFGVGRDFATVARINEVSIDQVLFDLLEPAKLTYLILGENLFLITTKERANNYKTTEIHLYASPDKGLSEDDATKLAEEMMLAIDPKSWDERDVALWIDVDSGCWIVRQTQPNQRAVRRWIEEHR